MRVDDGRAAIINAKVIAPETKSERGRKQKRPKRRNNAKVTERRRRQSEKSRKGGPISRIYSGREAGKFIPMVTRFEKRRLETRTLSNRKLHKE